MALERTLSIIKPDAVEKNHTGAIIARLEQINKRQKGPPLTHREVRSAITEGRK